MKSSKASNTYDLYIKPSINPNLYTVTWKNDLSGNTYQFEQTLSQTLEKNLKFWKLSINHTQIGEELFHFLDNDAGYLGKALELADRSASTLCINLHVSGDTSDWPFESLALNSEFLLTQSVHIMRHTSQNDVTALPPVTSRILKILFMTCSPIGAQSELNFEKEEEAIFSITDKLPIELDIEDSGSLWGLSERLKNDKYDVVHLSGVFGNNPDNSTYFIMEDEFGNPSHISPQVLWEKALIENPPSLLFLSGSNTAKPTSNIAGYSPESEIDNSFARCISECGQIPAVLGWGHTINDAPAILAAETLFNKLSRGHSILDAIQRTRFELQNKFPFYGKNSWISLRLYGNNNAIYPLIIYHPNNKPSPRRITYNYMENSWIRVLREGFVGRRRPIQLSLKCLKVDPLKSGILINGMGGLGKSCLAGKLIERFPNHTPIIIHGLLNAISLEDAMKNAFYMSQDDESREILDLPLNFIEKIPLLCASTFKKHHYLILLDDFEQNMKKSERGQPGPLIPEAEKLLISILQNLPLTQKQTQIIITSRYSFSLYNINDSNLDLIDWYLQKMPIPEFSVSENGKKTQTLKNLHNYYNRGTVSDIIKISCGNPRLLETIDKLIETGKKLDPDTLLAKAGEKKVEFIEEHLLRELISFGGKYLRDFLKCVGIFRRPVPIEAVTQMAENINIPSWKTQLQKGINLSLIEFDPVSLRYFVSTIVQDILLPISGDYSSYHKIAFSYYREICEGQENLDAPLAEESIYHALGCGEEKIATLQGAYLVASMHRRLALSTALQVGEWIIASKNNFYSHADAFLLNEVAVSAYAAGQYNKAISFYRRALKIDTDLYGEEHEETALDLNNIGLSLIETKEYKEALWSFEKALRIAQNINGQHHESVAQILNNIGAVYSALGNFQRAYEYFQEALSINRAIFGDTHPESAISFNNVGETLKRLSNPAKAIDYYLSALSGNRVNFGDSHPTVARDLNNIGGAYYLLDQLSLALEYLNQAYLIFRKYFGKNHINLAVVLNGIGLVVGKLNDFDKAIQYFEESFTILKNTYGEEHPFTSVCLNNLGESYRNKGNAQKATELFRKALDIHIKILGENHPDTAPSVIGLGLVAFQDGNMNEALKFFRRSLSIHKIVYGKEHIDIAIDYFNMAQVYEEKGMEILSKSYFKKSYKMFSKFLPPDHSSVIRARKKC